MRPKRSIGVEIKSISNLIKREIANNMQQYEKSGLTGMHAMTISFLFKNRDKELFQRDVETEFHIRRSTATGMLQRMEKNGLLLREPVSRDARLKKLVLTPKAIDIHQNVRRSIARVEEKLSNGLTEADIEQFFKVMEKIKKNLG